ncbi:MAG: hypothetical protein K0R10_2591 [Alphaproteobacteria bacterium]|jgi:uncharacterized protein YdcH (DUF465 family)|nr:hypothetical protein [Alphaproteobacteria bacterium]
MSAVHLDLAHELPEMKDAIHDLKISDNHFKRLFEEHETVAKELHRDGATMGDLDAEKLKKRRLELKDELYKMLNDYQVRTGTKKTCCGTCT